MDFNALRAKLALNRARPAPSQRPGTPAWFFQEPDRDENAEPDSGEETAAS
jgi:hypothetical protein